MRKLLPVLAVLATISTARAGDALDLYKKTTDIVTAKFYDRKFNGLDWPKTVAEYRSRLSAHSTDAEIESTLNALLEKLGASHTEFLSSSDQEYWGLKSIFSGEIDGAPFLQIGAWFTSIDGKWFVRDVFTGSAAEKAGLRPGDEILSADGKELHPVDSFTFGKPVTLEIRSTALERPRTVSVTPTSESVQRAMLRSTTSSFCILPSKKKRIAYFHLWSGTHDEFKNALAAAAVRANTESDVLILDLRNGFGGALPEYLDPFFKSVFAKPLVVLINDGVRSGKEWITYLLKEKKRATLVGTPTKGYFLAGMPFEIKPDRFLMYLAVKKDPKMPPLEHHGVTPDVAVPYDIRYSAGKDPVLESAIREAEKS